jgi:hypothetical protein
MGNFYTDVLKASAKFKSPDRVKDLGLLEPVMRKKVQAIVADAAAMGIPLMVFETFRSQARQQQLFEQGASKLKHVGVHNFGLAADIVRVVGKDPSWKGDFSFLGVLAAKYGLVWGGDWGTPNIKHSFVDTCHVQRVAVADQPELFRGEWYPDEEYDPLQGNDIP